MLTETGAEAYMDGPERTSLQEAEEVTSTMFVAERVLEVVSDRGVGPAQNT